MTDDRAAVTITACEDGPLLVRGPVEIRDSAGQVLPRHRATVALCRCGLTGRPPWCDGSHKAGRQTPAVARSSPQ